MTMTNPRYFRRADGRLEQMCTHGVGHTVAIDRVRYYKGGSYATATEREKEAWWSHGCCGCCAEMERLHD